MTLNVLLSFALFEREVTEARCPRQSRHSVASAK
jgi:hypothetical protein